MSASESLLRAEQAIGRIRVQHRVVAAVIAGADEVEGWLRIDLGARARSRGALDRLLDLSDRGSRSPGDSSRLFGGCRLLARSGDGSIGSI
jgi:hypothetical protein